MYFNYKHSFSIILLALVDAQYKFLFCSVGSQGRCSDGGVFSDCQLQRAIMKNTLHVPDPKPLPGRNVPFPFCIIADDAFPLKANLMKPFPHRNLSVEQRIFNYRLSRARRCVENSFGIMASRFRVLLNPMCVGPNKVDSVVLACCSLHNLLRTVAPSKYNEQCICSERENGGETNVGKLQKARVDGRRSATQDGKINREYLCQYFNSAEGSVSWQNSML
jgi:hypothetical protein